MNYSIIKYLKLLLIILGITTLSLKSWSQNPVEGTIKDTENKNPVKFATIYINGTTNGTISNDEGKFRITPGHYPSKLVVSCIGYYRKVLNLEHEGDLGIIYLSRKTEKVAEVTVLGTDNRIDNLKQFREGFLGIDRWGKGAAIENEEAIAFTRVNEKIELQNKRSKYISTLIAASKEPLQIDLPLLGYTLYVDVVQTGFNKYTESRLGYYYYKPKEDLSKRKKRTIENNRRSAYYNSSMHFLRSLYNRKLKQHGYMVMKTVINDTTGVVDEVEIDLEKYLKPWGNGKMLCDLKNQKYGIYYIYSKSGEPLDITIIKKRSFKKSISAIHFLSDSCKFRADGTTPDRSILFSGTIAFKKIGASLPSNYDPQKE